METIQEVNTKFKVRVFFVNVVGTLICSGVLAQFRYVHHILPACLILVPPTSFKKDESFKVLFPDWIP